MGSLTLGACPSAGLIQTRKGLSMTDFDDDTGGVYSSAVNRRNRRRKQGVVGIVGLVAILGGGAVFATRAMTGDDRIVRDTGALAPIGSAAVPSSDSPYESPAPSAKPSASTTATKSAVPPTKSPTPAPSVSQGLTAEQRIAAARAAASKAGFPLQRPIPQAGVAAADDTVRVSNSGSLASGGTLRVVTASYDLTGQRELAWAGDDGEPVGNARCTQRFHFSNDDEVKERPTMLLCWRTSADKSVVTVAVTRKGRPAKAVSVATIEKQWAKLD
jgi:hypothetical protein